MNLSLLLTALGVNASARSAMLDMANRPEWHQKATFWQADSRL
jgi:hypothetical protein